MKNRAFVVRDKRKTVDFLERVFNSLDLRRIQTRIFGIETRSASLTLRNNVNRLKNAVYYPGVWKYSPEEISAAFAELVGQLRLFEKAILSEEYRRQIVAFGKVVKRQETFFGR